MEVLACSINNLAHISSPHYLKRGHGGYVFNQRYEEGWLDAPREQRCIHTSDIIICVNARETYTVCLKSSVSHGVGPIPWSAQKSIILSGKSNRLRSYESKRKCCTRDANSIPCMLCASIASVIGIWRLIYFMYAEVPTAGITPASNLSNIVGGRVPYIL